MLKIYNKSVILLQNIIFCFITNEHMSEHFNTLVSQCVLCILLALVAFPFKIHHHLLGNMNNLK